MPNNKGYLPNGRKIIFGNLKILFFIPAEGKINQRALCQCVCGNIKIYHLEHVRSGHTKSCGCLVQHGLKNTPEWISWQSMKSRCYYLKNKEYKNYGGRGIIVCKRWRNSFLKFLKDMGIKPTTKHTIDRVNTNGNYTKGNCRWATRKQQAQNRRKWVIK